MTDFKLPDLGEGLPDAEIVQWLVAEGETIEEGQAMVEMSTAKAVVEVPAPYTGKVIKLYGGPGDVIDTGSVLVSFALEGEEVSPDSGQQAEPANAEEPELGEVFLLPDLGEGLPDAEIVQWLIAEGEAIEEGQAMVEMSTAKAVVEVPSPFSGTVSRLFGQAGDVIDTGKPLIAIATDAAPKPKAAAKSEVSQKDESPDQAASVVGEMVVGNEIKTEAPIGADGLKAGAAVRALARKKKVDLKSLKGSGADSEITLADVRAAKEGEATAGLEAAEVNRKATGAAGSEAPIGPAARSLADSLGIDPAGIPPTGPRGTVCKQDVLEAARSQMSGRAQALQSSGDSSLAAGKGIKAAPKVRAYARDLGLDIRAAGASGPAGNVTTADVDAALKAANEALLGDFQAGEYRRPERSYEVSGQPERLSGPLRVMSQTMTKANSEVCHASLFDQADIAGWPEGSDITGRIMRSVIAAAMVEPAINAWFDGETLEKTTHKEMHLGVAVDSPRGLFVPVVKNADALSPKELRAELNRLRAAITEGKIKPAEMSGGTLTLSNFGMIAGRFATPIIVPPEVAIIGIGGLFSRLVLAGEYVEEHRHMPLSLTFDHRAATGGDAARFMAAMIADLSLGY
jgi:pyruvate dehydrogenase E2 component (dihydrolipoamide acetyltransferase)